MQEQHTEYEKRGHLAENFRLFHIKDQKKIDFDYHHHDFHKIIFILSGKVTYMIEGKGYKLKPWDILFISNHQVHKPIIDPSEMYERIVIWFHPDFVMKYNQSKSNLLTCFELAAEKEFNLLRLQLESRDMIKQLMTQLEAAIHSNEFGSDVLQDALFVQLVIQLNRYFLQIEKNKDRYDVEYNEQIEAVIKYINTNLREDLTIDHLAENFFISKYYLMRAFKAQTGYSIHRYILEKRLILARTLISKGVLMTEACLDSGFNDYSSFVRAFKKTYGLSPKNYYKEHFR